MRVLLIEIYTHNINICIHSIHTHINKCIYTPSIYPENWIKTRIYIYIFTRVLHFCCVLVRVKTSLGTSLPYIFYIHFLYFFSSLFFYFFLFCSCCYYSTCSSPIYSFYTFTIQILYNINTCNILCDR